MKNNFLLLVLFGLTLNLVACGGKYMVKTFPAGAKVYLKDIQTQERKLIGVTPIEIAEESRLGNVFFLEFEKPNYSTKEVMVKVNEGESLTVSARLDPLSPGEDPAANVANKDDDKKQQGQPPQDDKKKKDDLEDLKLRVALLENTMSFYKDAMFSPRFKGGPEKFDRDDSESVVGLMFKSQQQIARGQYDKALEFLDKAIRLNEYSSSAWLLKGSASYLKKDYEAAKVAWEKTLKIDPYNKVAYNYLNQVYKRLGMNELPVSGAELRYPAATVEIEKRNAPTKVKK